jgi:predicted nuclease of predicted toxin-antitoxin system
MKMKLDENVDLRVIPRFTIAGHDVATVPEQGLTSAPDPEVIAICGAENRCLVTADRGFGNRMRFNPSDYAGIAVIRLPNHATFADWCQAIDTLITGLERVNIEGQLWIVTGKNIQAYKAITEE